VPARDLFSYSRWSTPEAELHPREKAESQRNNDAQRDGAKSCAHDLVHDCQQKEAQTGGQIPPSPVFRLKSAHPPIVSQLLFAAAEPRR